METQQDEWTKVTNGKKKTTTMTKKTNQFTPISINIDINTNLLLVIIKKIKNTQAVMHQHHHHHHNKRKHQPYRHKEILVYDIQKIWANTNLLMRY